MDNFIEFIKTYKGALIGIIVALIVMLTGFDKLILAVIVLGICAFVGNYIQHNKYEVKEKLKKFIDRV